MLRRAAIALALFFPMTAFGWGDDGHRIVCRIAYLMLEPSLQKEVLRLTKAYKRPDGKPVERYSDGCTFPDEARPHSRSHDSGWERFSRFDSSHFIVMKRSDRAVSAENCGENCLLAAIAHHEAALKSATTDQEKAEALFFLSHWIGDVHQPFHVSFADDQGGNSIKIIPDGPYVSSNLHAVWDAGIVMVAMRDRGWLIYANSLAEGISDDNRRKWVGAATPLEWAQESFAIATTAEVKYCKPGPGTCGRGDAGVKLDARYQEQFQRVVEMRLVQAGSRLAEILTKSLIARVK